MHAQTTTTTPDTSLMRPARSEDLFKPRPNAEFPAPPPDGAGYRAHRAWTTACLQQVTNRVGASVWRIPARRVPRTRPYEIVINHATDRESLQLFLERGELWIKT